MGKHTEESDQNSKKNFSVLAGLISRLENNCAGEAERK
jgi:hypothetical protein